MEKTPDILAGNQRSYKRIKDKQNAWARSRARNKKLNATPGLQVNCRTCGSFTPGKSVDRNLIVCAICEKPI